MRKLLLILGTVLSALVAGSIAASAANSSAHIVSCSTATACYSPDPIRISVGSTVTWTNDHTLAHTATADSGAWDTGAIAHGATSSAITFNTPGTFAYHCRFHSDMHGSIIVSAAATATATAAPTARPTTTTGVQHLAQSGGGSPMLQLGAGLGIVGLALLGLGALSRRRRQI